MAEILLGNTSLSSGKLDDFSKALLPGLCRSMAISFMEDGAGNIILEPPLGNKMIVLRPLPGPDRNLNLLLTTLSSELQARGANVLIVPAAASDGQLFRLWQTQVLFAFSQNVASGLGPELRFFYAPGKREESLGLIAALVRAMLSTANPPTYTIPSPWEHFKNFRYRRLLNNTGVPSVLIEFCRIDIDQSFVLNLTAWLVEGLVQYFHKPLDEATVAKLQPLLRLLQEILSLPGRNLSEAAGWESQELMPRAARSEIPFAGLTAPTITLPGNKARGATVENVGDTGAGDTAAVESARETALAKDAGKDHAVKVDTDITAADQSAQLAPAGDAAVKSTAVDGAAREDDAGKTPEQSPVVDATPVPSPEAPRTSLPVPTPASEKPPAPVPAKQTQVRSQVVATPPRSADRALINSGVSGLANPTRHRRRSSSFVPPGGGPIFVFQRPPEIAAFPSFFPQDVLERIVPTVVQSTFLTGQQTEGATPVRPTWQVPLQDPLKPAPQAPSLKESLKPVPQVPPASAPAPLPPELMMANGDNDAVLAELKRLSDAILAPEQVLEPSQEPRNGEAPSI